ncbi:MAG: HD-GYP domain-containing protein [Thermoanaerobaculia bacterium]
MIIELGEEQKARFGTLLARCQDTIGATKGALYLSLAGEPYSLVSWFGFRATPRPQVGGNDLLVERLITRKSAFWINGATSEQKFYDLIFHAGSESIFVAPIRHKQQLVGFLDLRDKGGRQPFGKEDLPEAKELVDSIVALFTEFGFYGTASVLASSEKPADETPGTESVARIVERARQIVDRELSTARIGTKILVEPEIDAAAGVLPGILNMQGVVIAAFTAFGHAGNVQRLVARGPVSDPTLDAFDAKLRMWASKQTGLEISSANRRSVSLPYGDEGSPVQPAMISSVLSAPIEVLGIRGLVLSIAFDTPPNRHTRVALDHYLALMRQAVEHGVSHLSLRMARQKVAEKLLEPDFHRYPDLVEHSKRISMLAEEFAQYLKLPSAEVEQVRLAGLLHDVGMRLLDYRRLYRKPQYNDDDWQIIRQHPVAGAAIVAESALGVDVAQMVLSHHERIDGKGYPHGLVGEQIPLGARVLHICDAFEAMTSLSSYQPVIPESAAMTQIMRAAGGQFDLELSRRFNEMLARVSAFGIE